MKWTHWFALPVLVASTALFAQVHDHDHGPATAPSTRPTTQGSHISDASYGIGYDIGKQMSSMPVSMDEARLIEGLRDALHGTESKVNAENFRAAMMKLQAEAMDQMKKQAEANVKAGEAYRAENGKKPGVTTTKSGLQIETIKEGTGPSPKPTDMVKVHYTGTLINGKKFDSSVDRNEPAVFGLNQVIPGWTEGLQLMKVGGKAKLVIPADIGYGPQGSPSGEIPPNSTLLFDIELLSIEQPTPPPVLPGAGGK